MNELLPESTTPTTPTAPFRLGELSEREKVKIGLQELESCCVPEEKSYFLSLLAEMNESRNDIDKLTQLRAQFKQKVKEKLGETRHTTWVSIVRRRIACQTISPMITQMVPSVPSCAICGAVATVSESHVISKNCLVNNNSSSCCKVVNFDNVPEEFFDFFTGELMVDPVLLMDSGRTYERASIMRWLAISPLEPFSGLPIKAGLMIPNRSLKSCMESYFQGLSTGECLKRRIDVEVDEEELKSKRSRNDEEDDVVVVIN